MMTEDVVESGRSMRRLPPSMAALAAAVASIAALAACGDPLAGVEFGNATIDGQCLADTPIAGSAVEATFVEDDGTLAEMPVATAVTDADGRFHLETGVEYGPLLITCTGGTTHDFATGDEVVLAPDARLALVLYDFDFDVELRWR